MSNDDYNKMSDSEKKKEDWMNSKWRPMCGWLYMGICFFDFVLFPILWSILQAHNQGNVGSQWQPLTLQGAGLLHLSFGAIIGVTAWGRTQEKLNGANNGGITPPTTQPATAPAAFGSAPATSVVGSPSFGAPASAFGSKPSGPAQSFPAL